MRTTLIFVSAVLSAVTLLHAQSTPAGSEFQINTYTTQAQALPSVAADARGDFVVVWQSYGEDGDNDGIFGRRFDSAGSPVGAEFQVNTYTTSYQRHPAVAMDASGDFVVVWGSEQDGSGSGIFAQVFDAAGVRVGTEFRVNSTTTGNQDEPRVAMDVAGNFAVVWESYGQDGDGYGIVARRFTRSGAPRGQEFQVNGYTTYAQQYPAISSDPSGNFTIVWEGYGEDGDGYGVFAQRYDNAQTPLGAEFRANTATSGSQRRPSVAVGATGDFVVAWAGGGGSGYGLFGRRFDAAGGAKGTEFQVSSATTAYLGGVKVAADALGNFVAVWQEDGADGSSYGIAGQQFNASGAKRGPEFQVNTYSTGSQELPAVVMGPTGDFVVAWTSDAQDGDSGGIFGQRFDCTDIDGDGICDLQDLIVITPAPLQLVDCHGTAPARPTIQWDAGSFDRFKVFISSDPAFGSTKRVTSGDKLLTTPSYDPPPKKWKAACTKALAADPLNPTLFIKIMGVDVSVPKSAPNRKTFSQIVQVTVQP